MATHEFQGWLFGPELPGSGVPAVGCWNTGVLYLRCAGQRIEIPESQLEISASGFNRGQTRISWRDERGCFAFCLDAAAREAFATAAPAVLAGQLAAIGRSRKRLGLNFYLGWAVLGGVLALPSLALAIFLFKADGIATWVAERIPTEFEAQIGERLLRQTEGSVSLSDVTPAAKAVREIGERLVSGTRHHYRWFVAQDSEVNAFAAPGGVVIVNSGLLGAVGSAEELAGVLAHEVSHVELRHSLKAVIKNLGLRALWSLVLGDYSATLAGEAAARLTELKFSREAETEADLEGVRRLTAAGISPSGMPRFFARLAEAEGTRAALPALLSTHPLSDERRARMQAAVDALSKREYAPLVIDPRVLTRF